jgi:hypothetical protein
MAGSCCLRHTEPLVAFGLCLCLELQRPPARAAKHATPLRPVGQWHTRRRKATKASTGQSSGVQGRGTPVHHNNVLPASIFSTVHSKLRAKEGWRGGQGAQHRARRIGEAIAGGQCAGRGVSATRARASPRHGHPHTPGVQSGGHRIGRAWADGRRHGLWRPPVSRCARARRGRPQRVCLPGGICWRSGPP